MESVMATTNANDKWAVSFIGNPPLNYSSLCEEGNNTLPLDFSFPVPRKRQQHISRHRVSGIARSDVQHSASDHRRHAVDRSAARLHSIYGLEILNSIEIPDDGAGLGFIGPDVPIPRSEKCNSGNHRHRSRLRSAAAGNAGTGWLWSLRQPQQFARGKLKRNQAATYFGFSRGEVRNPNVRDALIVAGAAPHRSAKDTPS